MTRQRLSRRVAGHRTSDRRRSAPSIVQRVSARDTAIMAIVAIGFIGAFWFALSKPTRLAPATPHQAPTAAYATPTPSIESVKAAPETTGRVKASGSDFNCEEPKVTDGDTLRCGAIRVRLASIDAPEMPGHCRRGRVCVEGDPYASKAALERLVTSGTVTCHQTDIDHYGRVVALCQANGRDLSCSQVASGHAIIRYGDLSCGAS
jgi:micrococcal nuclease